MKTVWWIFFALFALSMLGGWLVGMIGYWKIYGEARRAGRSIRDLYWFGTYRYAFNEKKGSRETRMLVWGFAAMLGSVLFLALAGFFASPPQ